MMIRNPRQVSRKCRTLCFEIASVLALIFIVSVPASRDAFAKVLTYTLVQQTRLASVVVIGTVSTVSDESVDLAAEQVIKGRLSESKISVRVYQASQFEQGFSRAILFEQGLITYRQGERVLLFLNEGPKGVYETLTPGQGKVSEHQGSLDAWAAVIQTVIAFDVSDDPEQKSRMLAAMLERDDFLFKDAALEIIYLESGKGAFATDPLIPSLVRSTQDPNSAFIVRAILAIGLIGDASTIPTLIDLMRSEHEDVAEAAARQLQHMTRREIKFDVKDSKQQREEAIRKFEAWWEANKDTAVIIR